MIVVSPPGSRAVGSAKDAARKSVAPSARSPARNAKPASSPAPSRTRSCSVLFSHMATKGETVAMNSTLSRRVSTAMCEKPLPRVSAVMRRSCVGESSTAPTDIRSRSMPLSANRACTANRSSSSVAAARLAAAVASARARRVSISVIGFCLPGVDWGCTRRRRVGLCPKMPVKGTAPR